MLKKFGFVLAGLFLGLMLHAQTPVMKAEYVYAKVYRAVTDPSKYTDPVKAEKLLQTRAEKVAELSALRKRLTKEIPELAALQKEFDANLEQLEKILESGDTVRSVRNRMAKLEEEAKTIPLKIKDLAERYALARKTSSSSDAVEASAGFKEAERIDSEIKALRKRSAAIPGERVALAKELRNAKRSAIRMDHIREVEEMTRIAQEMTLFIESTEEAKKINRDLKAIDLDLNKLLSKKNNL